VKLHQPLRPLCPRARKAEEEQLRGHWNLSFVSQKNLSGRRKTDSKGWEKRTEPGK